jgi:FKBP-type peptidyl-prolyl cis-trans isomerase (trigger factor)
VQVDFEGTLDGQPVETLGEKTKGLGKAQGHWVSADPDSFPPGMGDGIVGAAIGESRLVPMVVEQTAAASGPTTSIRGC